VGGGNHLYDIFGIHSEIVVQSTQISSNLKLHTDPAQWSILMVVVLCKMPKKNKKEITTCMFTVAQPCLVAVWYMRLEFCSVLDFFQIQLPIVSPYLLSVLQGLENNMNICIY